MLQLYRLCSEHLHQGPVWRQFQATCATGYGLPKLTQGAPRPDQTQRSGVLACAGGLSLKHAVYMHRDMLLSGFTRLTASLATTVFQGKGRHVPLPCPAGGHQVPLQNCG